MECHPCSIQYLFRLFKWVQKYKETFIEKFRRVPSMVVRELRLSVLFLWWKLPAFFPQTNFASLSISPFTLTLYSYDSCSYVYRVESSTFPLSSNRKKEEQPRKLFSLKLLLCGTGFRGGSDHWKVNLFKLLSILIILHFFFYLLLNSYLSTLSIFWAFLGELQIFFYQF